MCCQLMHSFNSRRLGGWIRPKMLHHKKARRLIDRQLESVASLEVLEFLSAPTLIDAVDGLLVQPLVLSGRNHAVQRTFGFCVLESSVARVPELPLTRGFPSWKGVTAEVAQDDLLKKSLEKSLVSVKFPA